MPLKGQHNWHISTLIFCHSVKIYKLRNNLLLINAGLIEYALLILSGDGINKI